MGLQAAASVEGHCRPLRESEPDVTAPIPTPTRECALRFAQPLRVSMNRRSASAAAPRACTPRPGS
jgi:hypothetical protein